MANGIDVSSYQGEINWEAVANAGVEFAIARAGYGMFQNQKDVTFDRNMVEGQKAKIPMGAYLHSYARTVDDAKKEAEVFLNWIAPYALFYPVAYDISEPFQGDLDRNTLTEIADTFLSTVQDAGYYVMLYSNQYMLLNHFDPNLFSKYDVWLANFNAPVDFPYPYGIWQFTNNGRVPGIQGPINLDISYKDYPQIIKDAGLNQTNNRDIPVPPGAPQPSPAPAFYTIQQGDTLTSLARRFGTTVDHLAALNQIENPDLIYAGEPLRIVGERPNNNTIAHVVRPGDSLFEIANQYDTTVKELLRLNRIQNPDLIYPTQVLRLPAGSIQKGAHIVKPGESLYQIAAQFGTTMDNLIQLNHLQNPNLIYPGQILRVN